MATDFDTTAHPRVVTLYERGVLRAMGTAPVSAARLANRLPAPDRRHSARHLRWTRQDLRSLERKGCVRALGRRSGLWLRTDRGVSEAWETAWLAAVPGLLH